MLRSPVRRVFILLGAYEDLTERETSALRRGDVTHAIALEHRKRRIAEAMAAARRTADLSAEELDGLTRRVRFLEQREQDNLAFLQMEMARTRASLSGLQQAGQRSRQVRRGYVNAIGLAFPPAEGVLGRA